MRPAQNLKLCAFALVLAGSVLPGCLEGGHAVVEPRGGEEWAVGTPHEIKWVSFGISEVRIEISRDGGGAWQTITGSTDADYGVYPWVVTGPASDDCLVRVSDAADPALSATSGGRFSIREKEIGVLVPSGDETWYYRGPDRVISWTSFGVTGNVDLFYSTDAGESWCGLAGDVPNAGSFLWAIPNENSTQCRVKVQEVGGATAGVSADFTIRPGPGAAFTDTGDSLAGVDGAALAWGDYDTDGRLDLVVAGDASGSAEPLTVLYHNEGAGGFVAVAAGIVDVMSGDVGWGDFDGDGDLDLAVAGSTDGTPENAVTAVYRNTGGIFEPVDLPALVGVRDAALAWGDCDNDGDLDLAVAGSAASGPLSRIYQNTGDAVEASFELYSAQLAHVSRCALAWGDYDNDGDLDLAIAGEDANDDCIARIYRNTKDGFVDSGIQIIGVRDCSLAWGDYDNDGDLDLAVAGYHDAVYGRVGRVYENEGGAFTDLELALVRLDECCVRWGDYDNDGDLDLAVAGVSGTGSVARVYRNDGGGRFNDAEGGLLPAGRSSVAWGDFDADGDLDLAVAGYDDTQGRTNVVYRNLTSVPNLPPSLPDGLETAIDEPRGLVTLSWNPATDAETSQAGLTYNLSMWDESGTLLYVPGMAHPVTGERLVPAAGNVGHNTTYTLGWLPPGHYTWAVQAVDSGFRASPWPTPTPPPTDLDADFDCSAAFANVTPQWPPEDTDTGSPQGSFERDELTVGLAQGRGCSPSGERSAAACALFAALAAAFPFVRQSRRRAS